jgi:hypothetical protein
VLKKSETEQKKERDSIDQAKYDQIIRELIDTTMFIHRRDSTIYTELEILITGIHLNHITEDTAYLVIVFIKYGTQKHSRN